MWVTLELCVIILKFIPSSCSSLVSNKSFPQVFFYLTQRTVSNIFCFVETRASRLHCLVLKRTEYDSHNLLVWCASQLEHVWQKMHCIQFAMCLPVFMRLRMIQTIGHARCSKWRYRILELNESVAKQGLCYVKLIV